MTKLSVNLNKVATLRNTRSLGIPSVLEAAKVCLGAGAHGITVHPRPDQRHIKSADVYELSKYLKSVDDVEFNIEGNPFTGCLDLIREVKPDQFTLVPDAPGAVTSNQGWRIAENRSRLEPVIKEVKSHGVRVSLFMDAGTTEMELAKKIGADRIELYTEPYASAHHDGKAGAEISRFRCAAEAAMQAGLGINAGHDLNLDNLKDFIAQVPGILEVSIGHALISDALHMGMDATVKKYLHALSS